MEKQYTVDEILTIHENNIRKNYALTELLAQTFSAFVNATGNKDAISEFIKSTSVSLPEHQEAHEHAKTALLKLLDSVQVSKN